MGQHFPVTLLWRLPQTNLQNILLAHKDSAQGWIHIDSRLSLRFRAIHGDSDHLDLRIEATSWAVVG